MPENGRDRGLRLFRHKHIKGRQKLLADFIFFQGISCRASRIVMIETPATRSENRRMASLSTTLSRPAATIRTGHFRPFGALHSAHGGNGLQCG